MNEERDAYLDEVAAVDFGEGPFGALWELGDWEFSNSRYYAAITRRYELFFEYLRISPSYAAALASNSEEELARRLGNADRASKVWRTREDAGDVFSLKFKEWWLSVGHKMFAVFAQPMTVEPISPLWRGGQNDELLDFSTKNLKLHIENAFEQQGRPDSVLVSIPLGRTRLETRKEIDEILDWAESKFPPDLPTPKYILEKNRIQDKRLELGLRLVTNRAVYHKEEFWRAAARTQISSSHKVDPFAPKKSEDVLDGRRAITIMGLKLYNETLWIAENAAMGVFPSLSQVAVHPFELQELGEKLQRAREIERKYKDEIEREIMSVCESLDLDSDLSV